MHRLKIHSKVKEEEKSKFREYESPLFYYMYEFFLHGFLFFLMKMSCVAQGVGAVGGESGKGQAGDVSPGCSWASRTIIRSRNDSPFGEKCSYTYVRVQSTEIASSVGACEINKCAQ